MSLEISSPRKDAVADATQVIIPGKPSEALEVSRDENAPAAEASPRRRGQVAVSGGRAALLARRVHRSRSRAHQHGRLHRLRRRAAYHGPIPYRPGCRLVLGRVPAVRLQLPVHVRQAVQDRVDQEGLPRQPRRLHAGLGRLRRRADQRRLRPRPGHLRLRQRRHHRGLLHHPGHLPAHEQAAHVHRRRRMLRRPRRHRRAHPRRNHRGPRRLAVVLLDESTARPRDVGQPLLLPR